MPAEGHGGASAAELSGEVVLGCKWGSSKGLLQAGWHRIWAPGVHATRGGQCGVQGSSSSAPRTLESDGDGTCTATTRCEMRSSTRVLENIHGILAKLTEALDLAGGLWKGGTTTGGAAEKHQGRPRGAGGEPGRRAPGRGQAQGAASRGGPTLGPVPRRTGTEPGRVGWRDGGSG